jgi:hypothetical protein
MYCHSAAAKVSRPAPAQELHRPEVSQRGSGRGSRPGHTGGKGLGGVTVGMDYRAVRGSYTEKCRLQAGSR